MKEHSIDVRYVIQRRTPHNLNCVHNGMVQYEKHPVETLENEMS